MAVVTEVSVVLRAKLNEFSSGLQRAMAELDNFGKETQKIGDSFADIGDTLSLYVTAPLYSAAVALGAFMTKTADAARDLDAMAQKMGMSTERLQELRYVASQTSTNFERLRFTAVQLNRRLVEGSEEGKELAAVIEGLGIRVKDTTGMFRPMDDLFMDVVLRLSEMEDITLRNDLVMRLFGRAGYEVIPMLNVGAQAIQGMTRRAHELGLVLEEENIKGLTAFAHKIE
ncbi:MAG: hypothetical protein WC359_15060, partial [Dehalococcoidia bacterium]